MNLTRRRVALGLALGLLLCKAADAADDFRFRVAVDVSCDDAALRNQLTKL